MAKSKPSRRAASTSRDYPRTARLNELVREILADELERVDDDRLELLTVVSVDVDSDLRHAMVYFDCLEAEDGDAEAIEALTEARPQLKRAIGRQAHINAVPELAFAPDPAIREGLRIDALLRRVVPTEPTGPLSDPGDASDTSNVTDESDTPVRGSVESMIAAEDQRRDGVAVVHKEAGWTSHDVVAKARGILQNKKIGHSGTLDPDAVGVLILGVGRVTRLLRFLTALPKTYVGEIVLGTETSTLDAAGEVTATHDMAGVTIDAVQAAAHALTGDIEQIPPMVSAVQVGGKRLHELAREGKEIEREPRPVTVYRFEISAIEGQPGVYRAEVDCSSGTYIRTLAADVGHALGGGAHLRSLQRTAIGSFAIADAAALDDIEVLAPREAIRDYPAVIVRGEVVDAVRHGKVLSSAELGVPDAVLPAARTSALPIRLDGHVVSAASGPWAVLDETGDLLAVYEQHRGDTVKPAVVIAPAAT